METKLGVFSAFGCEKQKRTTSEVYVHTMQTNSRFIVTLVEGYKPVVIGSKATMREWKTNNRDTIENRDMFVDISLMKKSISPREAFPINHILRFFLNSDFSLLLCDAGVINIKRNVLYACGVLISQPIQRTNY